MYKVQIYILRRRDALLKRLSKVRGLSEAEIIRQAIEREVTGVPSQLTAASRSAWQELVDFLEMRQGAAAASQPYRWDREEIYTERESRWLRDHEKD